MVWSIYGFGRPRPFNRIFPSVRPSVWASSATHFYVSTLLFRDHIGGWRKRRRRRRRRSFFESIMHGRGRRRGKCPLTIDNLRGRRAEPRREAPCTKGFFKQKNPPMFRSGENIFFFPTLFFLPVSSTHKPAFLNRERSRKRKRKSSREKPESRREKEREI